MQCIYVKNLLIYVLFCVQFFFPFRCIKISGYTLNSRSWWTCWTIFLILPQPSTTDDDTSTTYQYTIILVYLFNFNN